MSVCLHAYALLASAPSCSDYPFSVLNTERHTAKILLSKLLCLVLQAVNNQAALAAAKARFEQQQKENDEIAERNKRLRLGLPEPKPAKPEVQCTQNTVVGL